MSNPSLSGVVMSYSVILILDKFTASVSRRRDCRLAFAPADDFNTAMKYRYGEILLSCMA